MATETSPIIQDEVSCNINLQTMQNHIWYDFEIKSLKMTCMISPDRKYLFIDEKECEKK